MIYSYGFSIIGTSHVSKGANLQDANRITRLDNGIIIAAVADGVGSCKYSDVASQIAVDVVVEYCRDKIISGMNDSKLLKVLEEAYVEAEISIERRSLADNQPLPEYDTTLSVVVYDGKKIAFGHCGDGGIIGLTLKGEYLKITEPQKQDGMYVIPLRNGKNTWVFGSREEEFASLLLATDGVYDTFFPYLLKGQPVEIYIPLIRYFIDNNGIGVSDESIAKIAQDREAFLISSACSSITDDKTILVLINGDVRPEKKDASYYQEPDWDVLQTEWNKKAYPHLYEDDSKASD